MSGMVGWQRVSGGCLLFLAFWGAGCASRRQLATQLSAAMTPGHLRPVVACWEAQYEQSGFQGSYVALVDLEISAFEHVRSAKVVSLEPTYESPSANDIGPFQACLERAFLDVTLPSDADAEGPGFGTAFGVSVKGYRIAFVGDEDEKKKIAEGMKANVLIGPRADRCQGLYIYGPPRDTSALFTELAVAKERAATAKQKGEQDERARALQKTYDLQIELAARLQADLADKSLPQKNRDKLRSELEMARREKRETGALIGCGAGEER